MAKVKRTPLVIGLIALCTLLGVFIANASERYALLVSISSYRDPKISNLPPSEDADLMERVLRDRWGFKAGSIMKLKESQATRRAILEKLQEIAQRAQPNDAVLFFFSGHGGTSQQHFNLCPWDAEAESAVNDITEAELAGWVQALKTTNVTIILDCCFEKVAVKSPRIRPKSIGFVRDRGKPVSHTLAIPEERAVVLKACQEDEQALQEISVDGETSYGVFTYNLVRALYDASPETTYNQLIERLQQDVIQYIHNAWPSERFAQLPRVAGSEKQRNRRLFEPNGKPLPPYRLITEVRDDKVVLDAGESAGIVRGARYAVYPQGEDNFEENRQIALIEVTDLNSNSAIARVVESKAQISPNCRARLLQYPSLDEATRPLRCRMYIDAPAEFLTKVRNAVRQLEFIELVDTPNPLAQRDWVLKVNSEGDALHAVLLESDGKTAVQRVEVTTDGSVKVFTVEASGSSIDEIIQQMKPIWLNFYAARVLLNLKNLNPSFKVELSTDKSRYKEGDSFTIRFRSDKDCYLILVAIDPTGTPTVLYPWGTSQPQKIVGGKEYIIDGPTTDMKWVIRPPLGRECIVAIATLQAIPIDHLANLLQAMGQLQQVATQPQPLPAGIKSVAVEPVRRIQNLPLDQWNVTLAHFLTEGKDSAQQ
jgi:hypothetical protein